MRAISRMIIIIAVPLVLIMGAVRLTTLPWYPAWEYQRRGFPPDPYGMPRAERLRLARVAIRYLNVPRPATDVSLLRELELPDGGAAFNARELAHMVDVKRVYTALTLLAVGWLLLAIGAGARRHREGGAPALWRALAAGAVATLLLFLGLGLWMVVGFNAFFTAFHGLFFADNTWTFAYSDTLIRLFPLRFWQDAGFLIAAAVSLAALALIALSQVMLRQRRWHRNTQEQKELI